MLDVPEDEIGEFVNAQTNMALLVDGEPGDTKEYKELQPAYEYKIAAAAKASSVNRKDQKKVKESKEIKQPDTLNLKKTMRIKSKNKPQEKAPEIRTPVQQSLTVKEKVDKNETDTNEDKDDAVDLINALPIQER